jgi:hypothetical protein
MTELSSNRITEYFLRFLVFSVNTGKTGKKENMQHFDFEAICDLRLKKCE